MKMTLDEIACTEITDRSSNGHDYMRTYGELFERFRHEPVSLLEIGVLGGAGLRTWARYFDNPETAIYGLDPYLKEFCGKLDDDRIVLIEGSQAAESTLSALAVLGPFHFILDDGGHFAAAQMKCFQSLWLSVAPGGFYSIEDLHSYAAPELCDGKENIMQFLTRIATEMQGRGAKAVGKSVPEDSWSDIDLIMFRRGLAILRKSLSP